MSEPKFTLEEKLEYAVEKLEAATRALKNADAKTEAASAMGGGIPGFGGSGNQRAARQVRDAFSAADRAWRDADERVKYWTAKRDGYRRRIAERDRVRLTREDVLGAAYVRVSYGWCKVVRVNAKSVSVDSGYSWVDRIEFSSILEVRRAA